MPAAGSCHGVGRVSVPRQAGTKGRDTVQIIDGVDEHGHATKITTFADGLNIPIGVTPVPDGVIVYSIPNIYLCTDPGHVGHVTERKVLYGAFGITTRTA